jgi:hypothetical protein
VQDDRHEPTHGPEPDLGQQVCFVGGVLREKAVRAELRGGQAQGVHLVEHPVAGHLVAPSGHLADAPGDGGCGDPSYRQVIVLRVAGVADDALGDGGPQLPRQVMAHPVDQEQLAVRERVMQLDRGRG